MRPKFVPNKTLPPKARVLKRPIVKEVAEWSKLSLDAKLIWKGIVWYRVHRGFSEDGAREDWIAEIPTLAIAICGHEWNDTESIFKKKYNSFEQALNAKHQEALIQARINIRAATARLKECMEIESRLELATARPLVNNRGTTG